MVGNCLLEACRIFQKAMNKRRILKINFVPTDILGRRLKYLQDNHIHKTRENF